MKKRIFSLILAVAVVTTMIASFTITAGAASDGVYREDFTNPLTSNLTKVNSRSNVKYEIDNGALKVTYETLGQSSLDIDLHDLDGTKNIVLEYDIMFPADSDANTADLTVYFTAGNSWYTVTKSGYAYEKDGNWWHYRSVFTSDGTKMTGHTGTKVLRDDPTAALVQKDATATGTGTRGSTFNIVCNASTLGKTFWLDNIVCYSGLSVADTAFKIGSTDIGAAAAGTTGALSVNTNIKYGENDALANAQVFLVAFDASGMMIDCKEQTVTINPAGTNNGETAVSLTTDSAVNIDDIAKAELYIWNSIDEQQPLIEAESWEKP